MSPSKMQMYDERHIPIERLQMREQGPTITACIAMDVVIIGAGIAGLAAGLACARAGHRVTIFESAQQITEVGAGIQVAPNLSRLLHRWGVLNDLLPKAVPLLRNSLRRWENDEELGIVPLMPQVQEVYGAPLLVAHRADLHRVLLEAAESVGVVIKTGCRILKVDFAAPSVTLVSGTEYTADVVLAADGVKSVVRKQMMDLKGLQDRPNPTGDSAYRVLIPREKLRHDPELFKLINQDVGMRWMGPGRHVMAYPIKSREFYNMVLLHPDPSNETSESWTNHGNKSEMLAHYKGWNKTVTKLLNLVPEGNILEWQLNDHVGLPTWIEGNCALIGDACHPMLPYVAQGAAQAVEDGGVLEVALSMITRKEDVHIALKVYEKVRKSRGEAIQKSAATTRIALHLPDGPEQQERDAQIRKSKEEGSKNPDLWSDNEWQRFMWGEDTQRFTIDNWDSLFIAAKSSQISQA